MEVASIFRDEEIECIELRRDPPVSRFSQYRSRKSGLWCISTGATTCPLARRTTCPHSIHCRRKVRQEEAATGGRRLERTSASSGKSKMVPVHRDAIAFSASHVTGHGGQCMKECTCCGVVGGKWADVASLSYSLAPLSLLACALPSLELAAMASCCSLAAER